MWVRGTAVGVFGLLSVGCATPCVDDGFLAMQHDPSCMATGAPTTTSGESTSSATTSAVTTSGTDTASSTTAATTGPGTATTDATGTGTGSTTDASTGSTSAVSASTTDGTSTGGPSSGSSTTLDPMGDDDGDAVPNGVEQMFGTDPNDRDSDDDGILDGTEFVNTDLDNDGLPVPLDPDSDDDGLLDGTEVGTACDDPDTDPAICVADADPGANNTNPQDPDSDAGGASDGSEDRNLNGKRDMGETDNTLGDDDASGLNADGDGDGLSDSLETFLGSDPQDSDSDDDGVEDGLEKNPSLDPDGDAKLDVLDPDSDDDGLFDGTELGFDCSLPDTDNAKMQCVADADNGFATTRVLRPDTDYGGTQDGTEDKNHNGLIDAMETDPNNPADD